MRIVQVSAQRDPQARAPAELLAAWPTLVQSAAAVARAGADVFVLQAAHEQQRLEQDGVHFEFVPAEQDSPARLAAAAARHNPDVVHVHGLHFPEHIQALAAALPATPLLIQDHANVLPRRWRYARWRNALQHVAAVTFTARTQALPFIRAGLFSARTRIFAVTESATDMRPGDMAAARAALGITGDPVLAWVGRLNYNKDPITALRGFAGALPELPRAQLWMCYGDASLLSRVQAFLRSHPQLQGHVHLMGVLPRSQVEQLLRAADLFLAASHRESSGYALIEALACGVTPVVSDIPSFRALLADGAVGALFRPGAHGELSRELIRAATVDRPARRTAARQHFEDRLSFAALGRRWLAVYDDVVSAGRQTTTHRRASANTRPAVALVVPGGVDRSGRERVIPCLLWLIERLARAVELHVIALRQEAEFSTYNLLGAAVHCLPAGASRVQVLRELLRLHRRFDFRLWHALWMHPQGTLAGIAGRLSRRPVLLHINGGDLAALPDINFGGRATARGRMWLRLAVRGASHVTVPSLAMQRSARSLGIAAEVVTFGVATDHWPVHAPQPHPAGEPARLLHVASLNRVKDQPTLLRALATLQARGVMFDADLIGVDTLNGEMQRLSGQLGLASQVTFHGELPHDATRSFYERAHAFVLSSRHEADPIVALEAALAGVPTVGTAVGHLADWSPDAALAVPAGDADALAGAVQALLADDSRRRAIALNAQQRALAMDADRGAHRVLEIYQDLLARRPIVIE